MSDWANFLESGILLWSTIQFVLDMVLDMVPVMVRLQHALSLPSLPYLLQLCWILSTVFVGREGWEGSILSQRSCSSTSMRSARMQWQMLTTSLLWTWPWWAMLEEAVGFGVAWALGLQTLVIVSACFNVQHFENMKLWQVIVLEFAVEERHLAASWKQKPTLDFKLPQCSLPLTCHVSIHAAWLNLRPSASGPGKSSLIRAILQHFQIELPEDQMPVVSAEGDGTTEPTRYPLTNLGRNVSLWDLPGQGAGRGE